jgi:hypothetical protein
MHFVRQDYNEVFNQLRQSSIGDIVALNKIAGPTICCAWVRQFNIRRWRQLMYCEQDLATLLQQNWLETFKQQLKYIRYTNLLDTNLSVC